MLRRRWRSVMASTTWRFGAAWLLTIALIWVTYAFAHSAIVENMERDLQQRLAIDTLVLEDHASRALDGVVSRLESIAAFSSRDKLADRLEFAETLRGLLFDDTIVRSLSLVDKEGFIVTSSTLSSVGRTVTPAVWESIGPLSPQPRQGVRFGRSLAQRDLPDLPFPAGTDDAVQSIWLGHIDVKAPDLSGHRWVVAVNSGFFQNFWATATKREDVQLGLFNYDGQRLVTLGTGPAASELVAKGLQEALQLRDSGELVVDELSSYWLLRYRASSRHPVAFAMFVDRSLQVQKQFERTSALRWSAIGGSVLATAVIALFFVGARRYQNVLWASTQFRQEAQTDALTGLANRRAFEETVPLALARAGTLRLPLSLLVMDLDHFKSINDRFGHLAGDAVLREMAVRWQSLLRSYDLLARTGGEEFCVLLPGTDLRQAEAVALKLIEETRKPVHVPGAQMAQPVTVSVGVVGMDACPASADLDTLLALADSALYRAKNGGRNRFEAVSYF